MLIVVSIWFGDCESKWFSFVGENKTISSTIVPSKTKDDTKAYMIKVPLRDPIQCPKDSRYAFGKCRQIW